MKVLFTSLFFLSIQSALVSGQTRVVTDAGREVVVNEDGSWEFASDDQLATLPGGQRVRLKPDGTWESTEAATSLPVLTAPVVSNQPEWQLSIAQLTIESRTKRVQKNVRTFSETVFDLDLSSPGQTPGSRSLDLSAPGVIRVEDSSGKTYDILGITPARLNLSAGQTGIFTVRVDGSASFRRDKQFIVTISREFTGTARDLTAEIDMSRARERMLTE